MGHSEEFKSSWHGKFIARRPCVIILLCLLFTIAVSVVSFQLTSFKMNTSGNFYPRNDPIAKDWDAFEVRLENDDATPSVPERSTKSYYFNIFYEAKEDDNILQEKYFKKMREVERIVTTDYDYPYLCLLPPNSIYCTPQLSLQQIMYPTGSPDSLVNITSTLKALAKDPASKFFFDKGFDEINLRSKVTRTRINFGLPLKGFRNADDRKDEQLKIFTKYAKRIAEDVVNSGDDEMEVYAAGTVLTNASIEKQIFQDLILVSGSILVVFLLIWLQTWSFFLAAMGMLQILFTFPVSYAIYKLFQFEYFTALNFMAVFIILGIGADDIFVFTEFWKQSRSEPFLQQDLGLRMSWVWKRAGGAMFVTSFTTFAAFVATAISPIPTIRVFGVFSAITVVINFAYCITWYAACVVVWHKTMEYTCLFCPGCADRPPQQGNLNITEGQAAKESGDVPLTNVGISDPNRMTGTEKYELREGETEKTASQALKEANLKFLERVFYHRLAPFVNKLRWVFTFLFIVLVIVNIYLATQLKPPKQQPVDLPDGHPLLKILDMLENDFPLTVDDRKKEIYFVYGITGIDRKGIDINDPELKGQTQFDPKFDISSVQAQQALYDACEVAKARDDLVFEGQSDCVMHEFRRWRRSRGRTEIVNNPAEFQRSLAAFYNNDASLSVRKLLGFREGSNETKWIALRFYSTLPLVPSESEMEGAYSAWEGLIGEENSKYSGVLEGYQTAEQWVWMRTAELLVKVALTGLGVSLVLAYVVLILATLNIVVATLAFATMAGIIACVMGSMKLLGWDLAVNEAIAITILAGLSVDYVVHMAVSYVENAADTRFERVRASMTEIGVSIVGGAATTLAATMLMFFAAFPIFSKFGTFIFLTILFAFIFSVFVFNSMCAAMGPRRNGGSLKCWGKKKE